MLNKSLRALTFDCAEPERVARFGAMRWGTSYRCHPRDSPPGTIMIARCRLRNRTQPARALIRQVWACECSSSAPEVSFFRRRQLD